MRIAFAILRIVVGVGIIAAVVAQLQVSASYWAANGIADTGLQIANFFSFFTIESNIASAVVVLVGAFLLIARKGPDPQWFTLLRAVIVSYMVVTGVVYNLLLRGVELPQGLTLPWSNEVLHVIAPAWMLVDWLFAPGRGRLEWSALWAVVSFPLVWGAYTLIRGPLVTDELSGNAYWYPYPFMNPNLSPNGYLSVAFYMILIAAIVGLAGAGVIRVSRRRASVAAE